MAIDIKKLNDDYSKEKRTLDRLNAPGGLKDQITTMEDNIATLKRDYHMTKYDMENAKDEATKKSHEKDLNDIKKRIETISEALKKCKDALTNAQKKVDEKIEDLSKDPETKKKLDSILYKKYDRRKKEELKKKEQFEQIKTIIDAHPTVRNWLDSIEKYNGIIKGCNTIIRDLTAKKTPLTPEEQKRLADAQGKLPLAQSKLAARQADLVAYFQKNHKDIDKDLVESLHSYNNITRQMRGIDRTVANCDIAMDQLAQNYTRAGHTTTNVIAPATIESKPSWLHPIKRIKYMLNNRKQQTSQEVVKSVLGEKGNGSNLGEAYKYDIVQEHLKNFEKGLHNAAQTTRKDRDDGSR